MPRQFNARQRFAGLQNGWRSGLEEKVAAQLKALNVPFGYEAFSVPFIPTKPRKYTPDFWLPNGIVLESKGRFLSEDRAKHLIIKAQHPDLDIRFLFSNPNTRISKQSATTYGLWAETKGFKYAGPVVPLAWIAEPVNERSLAVVLRLLKAK